MQPQVAEEGFEKPGSCMHAPRRRLNLLAIWLSLLLPWLFFSTVYCTFSFPFHFEQPLLAYFVVGTGLLLVVTMAFFAIKAKMVFWNSTGKLEQTWTVFLFISICLAWFAATGFGNWNYEKNLRPYAEMIHLNKYSNVDPVTMRGKQLMDAGMVHFSNKSHLDFSRAMGFKNVATYCVAPIATGADKLATYDFWAVGVGCCKAAQQNAAFHCGSAQDGRAHNGMRWLPEQERPYFRLAVQQAEATYNITAAHPIFFTFEKDDPEDIVDGWRREAMHMFFLGVFGHFALQAAFVVTAALVFSKMSHL